MFTHFHICTYVHAHFDRFHILPTPLQFWRPPQGNIYILYAGSGKSTTYVLRPTTPTASEGMQRLYETVSAPSDNLTITDNGGHFDRKTDQGSADLYFHYYGMLQHQQNMLQDYIRTGT